MTQDIVGRTTLASGAPAVDNDATLIDFEEHLRTAPAYNERVRNSLVGLRRREKRKRGQALPHDQRVRIVHLRFNEGKSMNAIAREVDCGKGTVVRMCQRVATVLESDAGKAADEATLAQLIDEALRDAKRPGRPSKLKQRAVEQFVREQVQNNNAIYLSELCRALRSTVLTHDDGTERLGPSVTESAMCRFVKHDLQLTRKRVTRMAKEATKGASLLRRRQYVYDRFGDSANLAVVGTPQEPTDQEQWRLRATRDATDADLARDWCIGSSMYCTSQRYTAAQLLTFFGAKRLYEPATEVTRDRYLFVDETGVNWHSARRNYGRSASGTAVVDCRSSYRGPNHSVIIMPALFAADDRHAKGIVAHEVLVKRGQGTRRANFIKFLTDKAAPAVQRYYEEQFGGQGKLVLVLDNASIHQGEAVKQAVRESMPFVELLYQPPYMPTVHCTEQVNNELKKILQRNVHRRRVQREQEIHLARGPVQFRTVPLSLEQEIHLALSQINPKNIDKYWNQCGYR